MNHRTAIITGAGRGIGAATALELSRRGFAVALVSRTEADLQRVASLLTTPSLIVPGDVREPAVVEKVVARVLTQFGRIDAVVNNAGVAPLKSIEQTSPADWREVMSTNLDSAYYFSHFAWKALKNSKGAIVNLSSEASRDPFPGFVAYAPAKSAVNMLTLILHREGKQHGIRAYAVAPGAVETQMLRNIVDDKVLPSDQTLNAADVALVIASCVEGDLKHSSGEVIYLHR